jgi:hypothetical protein
VPQLDSSQAVRAESAADGTLPVSGTIVDNSHIGEGLSTFPTDRMVGGEGMATSHARVRR